MSVLRTCLFLLIVPLLGASTAVAQQPAPPPAPLPVFARVTLLAPTTGEWRIHIISHQPPHGAATDIFAGLTASPKADNVLFLSGRSTPWIDLSSAVSGVSSVRFLFETKPALGADGVRARFDIATAANDRAIVRSITEYDPGNVISLRIPADLVKDKKWLLSIREDTQRRFNELKALKLPAGPLPQKIWTMTGFRSNGQFYTDPAIAEMDFDIIKMLGMNGMWEQNGGQPGELRKMAQARGINRSTVYWRNVESPPRDQGGVIHLDWKALNDFIDSSYRSSVESTRKAHPYGMPTIIADLMDEPAGQALGGSEYQEQFREYLIQQGLTPEFFGATTWGEVLSPQPTMGWWNYFKQRAAMDMTDLHKRRLWYWAARFWNQSTARLYAMATRKVEELAPGVGTRVNFGPPWFYDYGTLPRGIDAFEFGKLRGVSLGFNEDWIGSGSPRIPLEINTLLMDWSRAAARPAEPLMGSYITRDSNRATVKLRAFGVLARECKIFDFYYYGPSYTFFDHWSDNFSMVQGVAELTRDLGQVDDILAEGHAPKARVALLYSKSWPVWKEDDTEQIEQMMVYVALLHAGIPVDFISDEQVVEGQLAAHNYKCLYVVNESVPAKAAPVIERWVRDGGNLWVSGWAGMRDEYNTPTDAWNELLAVNPRSWKPVGDLKRLGEQIQPADWQRPLFDRVMIVPESPDSPNVAGMDDRGKGIRLQGRITGQRDAYRRQYFRGLVQFVPWTAGKEYSDAAQEKEGALAKAVIYPTGPKRDIITGFALDAKVEPPATTSVNQILAYPLWRQHDGVILLANYTGEPAASLTVKFAVPIRVKKLRSLHRGELKFTQTDAQHVEVSLPLPDVTDILVVE